MSEKVIKKGIKFIPADALSVEAERKLNDLMVRKKESLNKLVNDYKTGVLVPQK